ncbi:MAG TPA: pyrroline-5-carboxylate reductase [Parachlamydiales bacterium]|nr:pyrroline-5-carboxylate reductase [Parachlamydiales bacterium]
MKMDEHRLGFIGFGHMAQILFTAMHAARLVPLSQVQFVQRDRDRMKLNEEKYKITATSIEHAVSTSDVLLLCVRPGQVGPVLQEMARFGASSKQIISILSGIPISFFQKVLGEKAQIVRLMPNVASSIGEGMTTLSFSPHATVEFRSFVHLFSAPLGKYLEIPESQMDLATAVAGSGPGFVFALIQAMADAAEKGGLSHEQALLMASQTFAGAAQLALKEKNITSLLNQITTPGGTTEAGLNIMRQTQMAEHFQETLRASAQRAKQMAEQSRS